jgi:DNA helicase-2/ATP-dependent DNA helicase PcrA
MDPTPQTFVDYVYAGLAASREASETYLAIEKIAQGILRLVAIADKPIEYSGRKHKHRLVLELLNGTSEQKREYLEFLISTVVIQEDLSEELWNSKWQESICGIAEKICGTELKGEDVQSFLSWGKESSNPKDAATPASRNDNVYLYTRENREVAIKVGSIHSAKGQTHTATLVLETAWHECNLAHIVAWLSGEVKGKPTKRKSICDITPLKTHYVAMTRPSHLLCLALHKSALCNKDGQLEFKLMEKLKGQKWRIVNVAAGAEL